jgi:hypothetical protein
MDIKDIRRENISITHFLFLGRGSVSFVSNNIALHGC